MVVAGQAVGAWDFACPDWVDRLKAGRSLVPSLPIDAAEGERAVAIFNQLRLPDVPGQPAMREAAGEWFRDIVRAAFGSLDAETGIRRVGEVFGLVPKKNSKTTGGAAISMTAMLMNERPNAEMLLIGPTQDVADLAFQQASGMVKADAYLDKRFHIIEHKKTIRDRLNGAKLRVKTFDMKVLTGSKPVFVLVDELHIMSTYSYASRVVGQIRGGLLPNPESLLIFITTQSDEPPAGVFKAELQYARGVRDGRITNDVRMLPVLYEFPEEMQTAKDKPWRDPRNWPMVLPNLGRSITVQRLAEDYAAALEKGDEEERRWASQHLNVQIGLALHSDGWAGSRYWLSAADKSITLDAIIERCDVAVVGVDGGGLDDLLGGAVIGRCRTTSDWLAWHHAWAHDDVLTRRKDIVEHLRDFQQEGTLTICEHPTQDLEEICAIVAKLDAAGLLPEKWAVGLDQVGISTLVDELSAIGVRAEDDRIASIAQGFRLNGAILGTERKLKDGTFWHDGSRLMSWVVGNAKIEQRGSAVLMTKQTAGRAKIDPLIALLNAVQLMSRNPVAVGGRMNDYFASLAGAA